ncbi:MAG: transcription antitermination factor NusB [Candidatus Krumholzibacteriia bacterium]
MGKRSKGRALLLQSMYAARISNRSLTECLDEQLDRRDSSDETGEFARALSRRVINHGRELEAKLPPLLENWDLARVGLLERLILVIALVELHHSPEVPFRVVINEACELARSFCDENAVRFVNGVLDRAAADLGPEASGS